MSKVSVITFRDIEEAVFTARTAMVGYIQCAINKSVDKTLEIKLKKTEEPFKFEDFDGNQYITNKIELKKDDKGTYAIFKNKKCTSTSNVNDLSSNELFTICSILDKFLGDEVGIVDDNTIDIECEVVE